MWNKWAEHVYLCIRRPNEPMRPSLYVQTLRPALMWDLLSLQLRKHGFDKRKTEETRAYQERDHLTERFFDQKKTERFESNEIPKL